MLIHTKLKTSLMFYNSLTRKKVEFQPLNPPNVGMYTCGPTVYDYASIGNFRTYITSDVLRRVLAYNGYKVKSVMNITDVGHLTGDNLGDADLGRDRLEIAAERESKTAWDIAKFYTEAFTQDLQKLNILPPDVMPKATEHIEEQIDLVKKLEARGFAYRTSDGIYFDTVQYEKETGKKYGELSTLDEIKAGARVEANPEKKDPRDFALWKFSYHGGRSFDSFGSAQDKSAQDDAAKRRHMEWESPWGLGFPGWHIECSAMSMKYLGETFDIHIGGEDLRQTHHPNEIAQSEGATGKPFVRYWIHATFLLVDSKKMSKSVGNVYRVADIEEKGINPLALRYLYLTSHYRDPLNFTWDSLQAAQNALERLRNYMLELDEDTRSQLSSEKLNKTDEYKKKFAQAINDDLNTPRALAVLWETVKSNTPSMDKRDLLLSFDQVFGLDLGTVQRIKVPENVTALIKEREKLRKEGKWEEADKVRKKIRKMGYEVEDTEKGPKVSKSS